ncbi:MAG: DUF4406 domain-containing protein [Bacteroidales bacterium]
MRELTIYISGAISNLPYEEVLKKFNTMEDYLRAIGVKNIVNPVKLGLLPTDAWEYCMQICLKAMEKCNAIILLSDWKDSRGARLEFRNAVRLGMNIYYQLYNDTLKLETEIKNNLWK